MNIWSEVILSGFIAFASMIISSFAGGGGTLILLTSMLSFTSFSYISLLAISKVAAACVTGASAFLHYKKQKFDYRIPLVMIFGSLPGTALATYLVQYTFDEELLLMFIPFLLFGIALYIIFNKDVGTGKKRPRKIGTYELFELALAFFAISIVNGLSGGMGIVMGSYMVIRLRIPFIQSIAYGMFAGFTVHSMQALYFLLSVEMDLAVTLVVAAGSVLGGIVGTKLQYLKGNGAVRSIALIVMIGMGAQMLLS